MRKKAKTNATNFDFACAIASVVTDAVAGGLARKEIMRVRLVLVLERTKF